MKVQIINKSNNPLPEYATIGSAGMDLRAELSIINPKFLFNAVIEDGDLVIYPGGRALIPTELYMAIPEGYEVQIRSRSGLALKQGVFVTNGIGTIDSDYRNSVGVILTNSGNESFIVKQGDRIAQAVLNKVENIEWDEVDALDDTERGLGGFNSTGIK